MNAEDLVKDSSPAFSAAAASIIERRQQKERTANLVIQTLSQARGNIEKVTWDEDCAVMDDGSNAIYPNDITLWLSDGSSIYIAGECTLKQIREMDTTINIGDSTLEEIEEELSEENPELTDDQTFEKAMSKATGVAEGSFIHFLWLLNNHIWNHLQELSLNLTDNQTG